MRIVERDDRTVLAAIIFVATSGKIVLLIPAV
jgi:hypothetical protein